MDDATDEVARNNSVDEGNIRQVLNYFEVNHREGDAIDVAFSNLFDSINICGIMNGRCDFGDMRDKATRNNRRVASLLYSCD